MSRDLICFGELSRLDRSTTRQTRTVGAPDQMAQNSESLPLEEQVEILKQQLAQAQNLTALGELVSTTTHEFNNVLMTIINYAKYGMRHQDKASREKAFEKILAAGNRAAKITNGVLGVARNRSTGQDATDLVACAANT